VCAWGRKCYEGGKTVVIRVKNQKAAAYLDRLLWTFDDTDFIPHKIVEDRQDEVIEPLLISDTSAGKMPIMDVLLETTEGDPYVHFDRYEHIIDFAYLYDDQLKAASRSRYKKYQTAGYRMRLIKAK